jgi:hypothetical protein
MTQFNVYNIRELHHYTERFAVSKMMYLGVFGGLVHVFSAPPYYRTRIRK